MRNVLLMTATIAPYKGVPIFKVTDESVRLRYYQDALDKYIRFFVLIILFLQIIVIFLLRKKNMKNWQRKMEKDLSI